MLNYFLNFSKVYEKYREGDNFLYHYGVWPWTNWYQFWIPESRFNQRQTDLISFEQIKEFVPFDPTIFNADFKPPAAALVEKSWGTNEMRSGLIVHSDYSAWPSLRWYSSASSTRQTKVWKELNIKPERMLICSPFFSTNAAAGGLKSALKMVGSNGIWNWSRKN